MTEFLKFLRTIDREVPEALAVHLICDNYATHMHAERASQARRMACHCDAAPDSRRLTANSTVPRTLTTAGRSTAVMTT